MNTVSDNASTFDDERYLRIPAAELEAALELAKAPFVQTYEDARGLNRNYLNGSMMIDELPREGGPVLVITMKDLEARAMPNHLGSLEISVTIERVITDPLTDEGLLRAAKMSAREFLEEQSKPGGMRNRFGGLGKEILAKSSDPVARRLSATIDARQDLALAEARLDLQEALSERGLGRINGLDLKGFDALGDEDFTAVLHRVVKGYPQSTPSGALYYVAAKGLKPAEFDAFYDATLSRLGWTRKGADIAFAFTGVTEVELDATQVKAFSDDAPQTLLGLLKDVVPSLGSETRRRLALSEVFSLAGHDLDELLTDLGARSISEVLADANASEFEAYAALAQARENGVDPLSNDVRALYARLPKHLKIAMVRQNGRKQVWAATALLGTPAGV